MKSVFKPIFIDHGYPELSFEKMFKFLIFISCFMMARSQISISKEKPTYQSSMYSDQYPSKLCVDDNITTICRTDIGPAWFVVDLQGLFYISDVIVHNQRSNKTKEIIGSVIQILSKSNDVWAQCGIIEEFKPFYKFLCGDILGEKVRVYQPSKNFLAFADIAVYGGIILFISLFYDYILILLWYYY